MLVFSYTGSRGAILAESGEHGPDAQLIAQNASQDKSIAPSYPRG